LLVRPGRLERLLESEASAAGARVVRGHSVNAIEDGTPVRVHLGVRSLGAEIVVLACGGRLPALSAFCRAKIVPMRAQWLEADASPAAGAGAWTASWGYEAWRFDAAGGCAVAGHRHLPVAKEVGLHVDPTDDVQRLLESNLRQALGDAPGVSYRVTGRYAATQAVSCDALPLAGAIPGSARVLVSGGFGTNSAGWALVAAEAVAELVLHGRTQHARAFTPRRFL
jgi:glycine/D-amino acid oxidase-like deaminating enzyme